MLYCVLHSVLAATSLKSIIAKNMQGWFMNYRLAYNIFAAVGLIAIIVFQISMQSFFLFQQSQISIIGGSIIGTAGLLLMGICISKYFKDLSGIFKEKINNGQLIIAGVHQWVRHPLYLGTFIFLWGGWLAYPLLSLLISNIVITIYTIIGIKFEEKKLVKEFGESYRSYQQQVPMILPFRKPQS
ncbi:MAG: isoprenylcysteine carboxylmethyltransferase family protein [Chitinophagaceae bacterium]|nr:isoprenylcysteine carboxylmethyltransferase family protein [Chitinophagaceae bacterium]